MLFVIALSTIVVKVKTNMPDENQPPNPQPSPTYRSSGGGRVIQPISSNVSPDPQPQSTPAVQVDPPTAYASPSPTTYPSDPIAQQSPIQPIGAIDGRPFSQQTPISSNEFEQLPDEKPSKWRHRLINLGILQAVGVAIFLLEIMLATLQSMTGGSGTEFIGFLILYAIWVPVAELAALINLVGLPIYMARHKPHGRGLVFSILSLTVSIVIAVYGAYSVYLLLVALPNHLKQASEQSRQQSQALEQKFASDNAKPEITKEESISLLRSCQLGGFYYTKQTSKNNGGWGELSSTGVVLTKVDGKPYRISIADRLVPELVPIAREAQKTCGVDRPQIFG